jgi:hypothetical protein
LLCCAPPRALWYASAGWGTGAPLRSARTQLNSPLQVVKRGRSPRNPLAPRALRAVRGGSWQWKRTYTAYQQPRFSRALVYAKSSTSCWIALRSRKLSARSCPEDYCASASSGCVRRRHSVQSVLPGALATALLQPSCWHRLPPPCAWQWGVPPVAAALVQPSCWQRLPPPCAWQWGVPPATAALVRDPAGRPRNRKLVE